MSEDWKIKVKEAFVHTKDSSLIRMTAREKLRVINYKEEN